MPKRQTLSVYSFFWFSLVIVLAMALFAALSLFGQPRPAEGARADLNAAKAKYPAIVGSRLASCTLCHNADMSLNPYGSAYLGAGRNTAAFAAIEGLDSDHDGFSNLVEIRALTFPGNGSDRPSLAATATSGAPAATRTNTPVRTATNTPTAKATATATVTQTANPTASPTDEPTIAPQPTETDVPQQVAAPLLLNAFAVPQ